MRSKKLVSIMRDTLEVLVTTIISEVQCEAR
jgi:hypothetical protein